MTPCLPADSAGLSQIEFGFGLSSITAEDKRGRSTLYGAMLHNRLTDIGELLQGYFSLVGKGKDIPYS